MSKSNEKLKFRVRRHRCASNVQWAGVIGGVFFANFACSNTDPQTQPLQLKLSEFVPRREDDVVLELSYRLTPAAKLAVSREEFAGEATSLPLRGETTLSSKFSGTAAAGVGQLKLSLVSGQITPGRNQPQDRDRDRKPKPGFDLVTRRENTEADLLNINAHALTFEDASSGRLSAADAGEDELDDPPPPGPRRPPESAPPADTLPDLSAEEWGLAPIRWGGVATWGMTRTIDDDHNFSTAMSQANALQGSSYVYQPWIAQVSGQGSYSTVRNWYRSDNGHEGDSSGHGKSYGLGGNLSLFPQSHFPANIFFNFNRSKSASSSAEETDKNKNINTTFGLTQSYTPRGTNDQYSMSYTRDSSKLAGPNTLRNSLNGDYSTQYGTEHTVRASLRYNDQESGLNDVMDKSLNLTGSHAWIVNEGLRVNSSAILSQTENDVFQDQEDRAKNRSMVTQFNSQVTWQPRDEDDEPIPLTVSGSGTLLNIENDAPDASKNRVTLINGNLSANYRFFERLSGSGNFNLSRIDSNGVQNTSYGAGLGLTYVGMPTQWDALVHNWSVGTGGSINRSTGQGGTDIVRANFSQGLSYPVAGATLTGQQSVSSNRTSSYGIVNTLTHSIGLSKSFQSDMGNNGSLSATYSHNKTAGTVSDGHVNSFNISGSGQLQLSRRQSLGISANATWGKTVQKKQETSPSLLFVNDAFVDIDEARWAGATSFSYSHFAPFDVRDLMYNATISFSSAETSQQPTLASAGFGGLVNPIFSAGAGREWIHTMTFSHGLAYKVGRLSFQLTNVMSRVDGMDNVIIFGQVTRNLGGF